MDIQTQLIHVGEGDKVDGAVVQPIFQSATYLAAEDAAYDDVRYIRLNNTPNQCTLNTKLATVCGGEAAQVMGSGMAAITTALMSSLQAGDHLLIQDCVYGGTHGFVHEMAGGLGITVDVIAGNAPETWDSKLLPTTRAIYVEAMTNPLLEVADLEAAVEFARRHGLKSMIDNTFAPPGNFRPLAIGFDLELHSATKYLNGHSDIVAGAVIGSAKDIAQITHRLNHLGGSLDPNSAFLLNRGLKTLALRLRQHNINGQALAEFLQQHPAVNRVNYPGLSGHAQHARASRLFDGFGGMLSFELAGGKDAALKLLSRLKLPANAPSLGGVESLITRPAATSHAGLSPDERARLGISDGLIRVSCGIEAAADLCADFEAALS